MLETLRRAGDSGPGKCIVERTARTFVRFRPETLLGPSPSWGRWP